MNSCSVFQRQLSEFVDGEINVDDAAASLDHSGNCRQCRAFLSSVLMVRPAAAHIFAVKVPKRLDDRIHSIPGITQKNAAVAKIPFWQRRLALSYPIVILTSLLLISIGVVITKSTLLAKKTVSPNTIERTQPQMLPTVEIRAIATTIHK